MKKKLGCGIVFSALILSAAVFSGCLQEVTEEPPATPAGLSVAAVSSTSITVSWTAVSEADSYMVYRAAGEGGNYTAVDNPTSASFTDTGLTPNTTYWYKVSAKNGAGESGQSLAKSATTQDGSPEGKPAAPSGLSAAAASSTSITVSWTAVSGAASYKVYRSGTQAGTYAPVGTPSTSPYTDTGLTANTTYWYKISAVNGAGESVQSTAVSGKTESDADSIFNEQSDGKLLVSNTSADDLVLFYDTVTSTRRLGGISGNADRHKIKLPAGGQFYVIHAVKYADYRDTPAAAIGALKVVDSAFAYSDPVNETSIEIGNPNLGGNAEIQFINQTPSWIEVGKGSPNSEDRFYVLKPNSESSVFVTPNKDGFPLYYTVHIPMKKSGQIIGVQRSYFDADRYDPQPGAPAVVTISSTGQAAIVPFYREGYVRILNNSGRGYTMINGSTTLYSTLQVSVVASGREQVFELLGGDGAGQSYQQLKLIAAQAQYNKDIPAFNVKNGYAYTVEIDKNMEITISEGIELDPEREEIPW